MRQVRDRRSSWKPPTQHNVPKWLESRDCDPFTGKVLESRLVDDPSAPGGKRGMRFADFMLHPIVLLCQMTEAEVFALRFYTTAGFKGINWQEFLKIQCSEFYVLNLLGH